MKTIRKYLRIYSHEKRFRKKLFIEEKKIIWEYNSSREKSFQKIVNRLEITFENEIPFTGEGLVVPVFTNCTKKWPNDHHYVVMLMTYH